jgi:ribosomal-protein-alanine N-acetyltransferase
MSQRQARAIAAWRYDPSFDFYDAVADPEDLAELLDPVQRESRYFTVLGGPGGLVGFFMVMHQGDTVEVGLELRPDLTGSGRGLSFLLAGLEFAREQYASTFVT